MFPTANTSLARMRQRWSRRRILLARGFPSGVGAVGVLAALVVGVSPADAIPTVTLKGRPVAIPGFPHTGDFLGAGADAEVVITISGSEYDDGPPPVTGISGYFPAGTRIHTSAFATCPLATLERHEPEHCPSGSKAGPAGGVEGFVTFGSERVPEKAIAQGYYGAGGTVNIWTEGRSPTVVEVLSKAHWSTASAPYGPELVSEVPLVETLPGAPDVSITSIKFTAGGAVRKHGKSIYYGTLPTTCPAGGWPTKVEVAFLDAPTVSAFYRVPCPARRGRKGRRAKH